MQGGQESDQRADQHHPFHAQVQDAALLGQDLAQGCVEDGGPGLDRGRQQGEQDFGGHRVLRRCSW
jgi:hypothetical protein